MADRAPKTPSSLPGILAGILLVYVVLLGGSEAGVFLTQLQVLNAAVGAVLVGIWILLLHRSTDLVDRLAIAALVAFVLACLASGYPRQSFDAATAALTWAAAFGVGRRLMAEPRYRVLTVRLLLACGALLGLAFAVSWGQIWFEWIKLTGDLPPLELTLPPRIYRHYYVVAMLLAALAPASAFLLRDRFWRLPAAATLLILAALSVLSGSRTVWLGLAVAAVVWVALLRPPRRTVAIGSLVGATLVIAALGTGFLESAVDRLSAVGTVSYRFDIWRSALAIWADDPLTGIGPGALAIGLNLSELTDYYYFANRHADNAFMQLAAEGGILGLAAASLAVAAVFVGRQRTPMSGVALVGLVMLGGFSLTNNPTDSPNLTALMVVYAALATPFNPTRARAAVDRERRPLRLVTWSAAGLVFLAVASVNVAALAHNGLSAAQPASAAAGGLTTAIRFDPGLALYHRELGVALMTSDPDRAATEFVRAVELNPADTTSLRGLALARSLGGDAAGAADAARQATDVRPLATENWLVAAMVSDNATDMAVAETLRLAPWLAGSPIWPTELKDDDLELELQAAAAASRSAPMPRDRMSLAWLQGLVGSSRDFPSDSYLDALVLVLSCDIDGASAAYQAMGQRWGATTAGIVGRVMLARLTNDPQTDELIRLASLDQPDVAVAARGFVMPYSAVADPALDQQMYRRTGLGPEFGGMLIPRSLDALSAWMTDPRAAASRAVSHSALASCLQ